MRNQDTLLIHYAGENQRTTDVIHQPTRWSLFFLVFSTTRRLFRLCSATQYLVSTQYIRGKLTANSDRCNTIPPTPAPGMGSLPLDVSLFLDEPAFRPLPYEAPGAWSYRRLLSLAAGSLLALDG